MNKPISSSQSFDQNPLHWRHFCGTKRTVSIGCDLGLKPQRRLVLRLRLFPGGVQKMPFAIFSPFCFIRGRVELATALARTGRIEPRFFSTKS